MPPANGFKGVSVASADEWQKGSIQDWVMEGHRLAQTVAYGELSSEDPAPSRPCMNSERTR
jgi:hypothetical protein